MSDFDPSCDTAGHHWRGLFGEPKKERCIYCCEDRKMPLLRRFAYWLLEKG